MWYTIKRTKNIFTISKTGVNPVNVVVYKQDSCLNDTFVEVIPLQTTSTSIDVTLSKGDGVYKFVISSLVGRDVESVDILIPYYDGMLVSLIQDIDNILCGCECKTCDDCNDTDKNLSTVLLKLISYYTITSNYYSAFLDAAFKCLKCSIVDANECIILNEKVVGNSDNTMLLKRIVALYYLAFYFAEFKSTTDTNYINTKFNYEKIKKCINALGIDIQCILDNINDMGLFTITSSAYINRPPSEVGDFSMTVNNRAETVLTAAMFTTSTTPAYADPEGDAADAIRIDSLPATGQLLYNSNPVTVGQVITIADINGGLLKYVSPNQNAQIASNFNFSVRDTGSMIFTS